MDNDNDDDNDDDNGDDDDNYASLLVTRFPKIGNHLGYDTWFLCLLLYCLFQLHRVYQTLGTPY